MLLMALALLTLVGMVVVSLFHAGTAVVALVGVTAVLALGGALLIVIPTDRQLKRAEIERRKISAEIDGRRTKR
jgi:hypothetical protein